MDDDLVTDLNLLVDVRVKPGEVLSDECVVAQRRTYGGVDAVRVWVAEEVWDKRAVSVEAVDDGRARRKTGCQGQDERSSKCYERF